MANDEKNDIKEIINLYYETRRFETDLYWKRSQYFWTLIGVVFTAYSVLSSIIEKNELSQLSLTQLDCLALSQTPHINTELFIIRYLLVCMGLIFSIGWYLVNRGSKYTSEKWSLIIDKLNKSNPLLKELSLLKPDIKKIKFINLIKEYPFSSTRVNHIINLFIIFAWLVIFIISSISIYQNDLENNGRYLGSIFLFATLATIFCLLKFTQRSKESLHRL